MTNGSATVVFDAAFTASIDARATCHVFPTPGGDTRGLYVAQKTPTGFIVRETQGGRGTLDFDYQIVAALPGRVRERMAILSDSNASEAKAPLVVRHAIVVPKIAPPALRGRKNRSGGALGLVRRRSRSADDA